MHNATVVLIFLFVSSYFNLDLNAKPIIAPNYLSTESDCKIAVEGIEIARKIFAQEPFASHAVQEHVPGADKVSYADLVKAAGGKCSWLCSALVVLCRAFHKG